jgi:anti-sigma B factor antagonist
MRTHTRESTRFVSGTTRLRDGTVVLSVVGEIDLDSGPSFDAKLADAIGDGSSRVIIDLSGCDFLDSTGLSALVHADLHLNGKWPLILIVPPGNVLRVLEITRLDDHFVIHRTLAAALDGDS